MANNEGRDSSGGSKIRAARLSAQQFEVLIEFMQEHPHFAVGRASGGSYSKEEHDILWKTLSSSLNETEGPVKSVTKWQKCWVDLKSNARSRAAKYRALSRDGPCPWSTGSMFTQWDERVLRLLNDISANGNKFVPIVADSPLQLLEVGFSEKLTNGSIRTRTAKSNKQKFHPIAPKPNGYHISENGTETMESTSSHAYNLIEDLPGAEEDMEELIAEVKSEGDEEWMEHNEGCGEAYHPDSISPTSGSPTINYITPHILTEPDCPAEEEFSGRAGSKKRKRDDLPASFNLEDSLERVSKKICGTLDRMAAAAEEANSIQHGMVTAMNRLASSFEQLLPIVAKVLSNNLKAAGSS